MAAVWIIPIWCLAFTGLWLVVVRILRAQARMRAVLDVEPGIVLRESGWGSANINGLRAKGCVRVVEHREGWVVRLMPLFGGGRLWLPRTAVQIGPLDPGGFGRPPARTIVSGEHQIRLYGRLAEFVADSFQPPTAKAP